MINSAKTTNNGRRDTESRLRPFPLLRTSLTRQFSWQLFYIVFLLFSASFAQQFNRDIVPTSSGLKIGHSDQQWDAFFRNITISGTCTGAGCGSGGTGSGFSTYTVATLPATPPPNTYATVTDATGASCSVGGGTATNLCRYTGFVWTIVSGSAGGAGNPAGNNKQFQFNFGGAFGGTGAQNNTSQMTYDSTTGKVSIPNLAGIRYADSYAFSQSPGADLTSAGAKTVTLAPCPLGIDTSNNSTYPYYVYISTTGTPEAVLITGGTCTGGAASGTVTFTTVNNHANGYTLSSASGGVAEASLSIGNNNQKIVLSPAATSASAITNAYYFYAPVYFKYSSVSIEGGGALVLLNNPTAIFFNQQQSNISIHDVRVASAVDYPGQLITNTACGSNASTITTTLNPPVGSWVDIQFTFDKHYWGTHQVATASPSSWTYADTNCGGSGTIASAASDGANAPEAALIHDNGIYNTYIDNVYFDKPGAISGHLNNGIVVYNNQGIHINNTSYDSGLIPCSTAYCGQVVYAPGPFNPNAAVLWLDNDNFTMNCTGNALTDYAGNDLKISGGVFQGYSMWAINTGNHRGGFGAGTIQGLHIETGVCNNPWFSNTPVSAGILNHGTPITYQGGVGPQGVNPIYTTGGSTTYYYYVIVKDSVLGASQALYAGSAIPSGNAVTVTWFRVQGTNTVTYDVLRTTDSFNYPTTAGCSGGSTAACGSRTLAKAQCSANLCSFADDVSLTTSTYTVINYPGFMPVLNFWPGKIVLSARNDTAFSSFGLNDPGSILIGGLNVTDNLGSPGQIVTVAGTTYPSVTSQDNSETRAVGAWVQSVATVPVGLGGVNRQGATLLSNGFPNAGMGDGVKGRLNLITDGGGIASHSHLITLVDSDPQKTKAQLGYRPIADAADTSLCLDNASVAGNLARLCLTSPVSISSYINSLPDGTNWLERLTASAKNFKVPVTINDGTGGTKINGAIGTVPASGSTSLDVLGFDPAGDLAFNKKNAAFNRKVIPQDYTFAGLPAANAVDPGQLAVVTDALSAACPVTAGGGSNRILVRSNGTTWDGVCGAGTNGISVGLFSALPGSPVNGQLAIVIDWTGSCPVTSGSGAEGINQLVKYNTGTAQWKCVRDGTLPFITTAQAFDGAGAGGIHFNSASSSTNTSDQFNLHTDTTGNFVEYTDSAGPPGLLYTLGMWLKSASLPGGGTTKCLGVDSTGHIVFSAQVCFLNPMTTQGDMIFNNNAGSLTPTRLPAGTSKQILQTGGTGGTAPAWIDFPSTPNIYPAAKCIAGVATASWSSASGWTAACRAGTNNLNGVLQAIPSTGATAYLGTWEIPLDWDSASQPFIILAYGAGANTSGTVIWTISSGCTKRDGSVTDDPAWVAESAMGTQTMAVANRHWEQSAQFANVTSGNSCVAGGTMFVKAVLSGTAASAINVEKAVIGSAGRLLTPSQAN